MLLRVAGECPDVRPYWRDDDLRELWEAASAVPDWAEVVNQLKIG
jgi:hypothetical protein